MTMRTEYDRQQPYSSLSSCSWDNSSSSLEAVPSTPDASGHVVGNMRPKSEVFGPRPDYSVSYSTNGPRMRRSSHPVAAEAEFGLDYVSEHQYGRLDRLTDFSNCNSQSVEHHNEIDDLPRRTRFVEEIASISNRWSFDSGGPSPLRVLQYGDEIPSRSTRKCNGNEALPCSSQWQYAAEIPSISSRQSYGDEIPSLSTQNCTGISHSSQWHYGAETPLLSSGQGYGGEIPSLSSVKYNGISRSSQWHYGAEIPSLSSRPSSGRQCFGDEIPSLSGHWQYRDKIPLHSGQRCHDAVAHRLPSYQQGAFRGSGHLRYGSVRTIVGNQQVKMNSGNQTVRRPRVANRAINSTDRCRVSKKDNPWRNSEDIRDQVRGPRANKLNDAATPTTKKDIMSPLVRRDQLNRSDFSVQYEHAKFFMIKSYSEDDIHKGIKYNVWASTPNGNNKLDSAFQEAQVLLKEKGTKCPVFLFFSVNTSGQFVGLAEMLGPVDFKKTMDFWQQDKWNGFFPVVWHIIKDIPNRLFKHITLENNDNRPVTFSRDTQEIGLPQGLEVLKIFKGYRHGSSILDDFDFYEEKENKRCA